MDVPPIADATPEPASPPPAPTAPAPRPGLEDRLANLEIAVAEINERLDALSVSLEASLREAVTQEVQVVSGELRHTVAELGRLLVRDLGKLSKLLSEHRNAIVAELAGESRNAPAVPATAPPTRPAGADGDDDGSSPSAGGLLGDEPMPLEAEADAEGRGAGPGAAGAGDGVEAAERQRRSLLRRRHG
ncbi:MAG TPA: hypothetical protein VG078_07560 [Acidimicrobiales bacterium]|nr:hypothetical protein [Acidimicrobiales bacterium]